MNTNETVTDFLTSIPFSGTVVLKNTLLQWSLAVILAAVLYLVLRLLILAAANRVEALSQATKTGFDDVIAELIADIRRPVLLISAVYAASFSLSTSDGARDTLTGVFLLGVLLQAGIWGSRIVTIALPNYLKKDQDDPASTSALGLLTFLGKVLIWTIVLILVLDNLGVDITALIAGLGVGGIAVALAVQNILGDLLASLSIVLDKPFRVGDFIIVGDLMGTVEQIGIKTTRLTSLSGEQLVFSNSDLLSSRVRNYKRMYERRIGFSVGVTYQTPREKLEAIPGMIREIVEAQDQVRFDRSHFKDFGDFSLNFETVYYVLVPDYNVYMDKQQAINFGIYKRFEEEGIEFAYPTQTLFLEQAGAEPKQAAGSE